MHWSKKNIYINYIYIVYILYNIIKNKDKCSFYIWVKLCRIITISPRSTRLLDNFYFQTTANYYNILMLTWLMLLKNDTRTFIYFSLHRLRIRENNRPMTYLRWRRVYKTIQFCHSTSEVYIWEEKYASVSHGHFINYMYYCVLGIST